MAKIVVTGGVGYIGSVLTAELLYRGHTVTVIDNFMYGQSSLAHLCMHKRLDIVRADVCNIESYEKHLKGADYFIPLAALVGAPLCDRNPKLANDVNVVAIDEALHCLNRDQRVLIPITNSGYGIGGDKECDENSPLKPISTYGKTKVYAEQLVRVRGNGISLRLATVFGMSPRMRLDLLVNDFVYRAVNDRAITLFEAHFKRNYIHVMDVVQAFIMCIENYPTMKDQVYNVGLSSANLSKRELCEEIKKHVPELVIFESEHGRDPDKRDYIVSNRKIEAAGWHPLYTLQDGIKELIKGFQMIRNSRYGNI